VPDDIDIDIDTEPTAVPPGGRIEPVDLQKEMERSYLDYAMSVIVSRALPDVRDGLKPVHRRVLYAMYDGGYRPDRGFSKSSRVVGDVMGQYHPHSDTAIYDTLVRLGQPWALRYPLVQSRGNFGSPGDDRQAAMRYCLAGDTRIRTVGHGSVRIADLVGDARPNSDNDLDLKVVDRNGIPVHASKLFHSGLQPTRRIRTREGFELVGTHNHPVLCLVQVDGQPVLDWRLLEEIEPGTFVALQRTPAAELGDDRLVPAATRAGESLRAEAERSDAHVPEFVWRGSAATKAAFLRATLAQRSDWHGALAPPASDLAADEPVVWVTGSRRLAAEIQQLLLERGVVSAVSPGDSLKLQNLSTASADHRQLVPVEPTYELRLLEPTRAVGASTDGRFYFAPVVAVEDAGVQPVFSIRVDTDTHDFVSDGFVSHNTECRLAPLAMEMVRDIDEDTVNFSPNYDGRQTQPDVLPARFPNLLVNGSGGIAVGMATNIPPHNLREVATGVQWLLDHPEATNEELLAALIERIQGPDFPTKGLIVGRTGIEEAYRTGRGSVTMRAVVEVEEDAKGRACLVISELPYQVNPDALARKIAELADRGKVAGIADLRDDSSSRTGMRIVVVLKRDAVASVVRNNLYKHTQLQDTFGCNMLALVDGIPRTLPLDAFVRNWVNHQIEVIQRRTSYRLRKAEERAHILRGLVRALDALDEVIALIRRSPAVEDARVGLIELLDVDELQANAILDMQLRRLAALERQKIVDELALIEQEIAGYEAILASEPRQREIVSEELAEIVGRFGDERRTRLIAADGDLTAEDFIPREDVVVTITTGGYAKRTRADLYRAQRRGGKGVRGAQLRQDDIVGHFFVTSTHDWLLFFTNQGRVYRAKAYELPELARDSRGQHVANLLEFAADEKIAQVLAIPNYDAAPYLVLATKFGRVKKTRLPEYDSPRSRGLIAVVLNDGDELIAAELASSDDDLLLVSRKARSVRFTAGDEALRPMGRSTAGVLGMRFVGADELLSMSVVNGDLSADLDVFVVTDGGWGKRTPVVDHRVQGRGGLGILAAKVVDQRGSLVGALVVHANDEILAITSSGGVIRTRVDDVRRTGRATMGVRLINVPDGGAVVAIARNAEQASEAAVDEAADLAEDQPVTPQEEQP